MSHFIFRDDGSLIAHPDKLAEIVASGGQLQIQNSGDPMLSSLYQAVKSLRSTPAARYDDKSQVYFAATRLAGPGWYFMTVMPRARLRRDAFESAQWVLWTGLSSLALLLLFHTVILRRQVARPLARLMAAVEGMRRGEPSRVGLERDDELGRLGRDFDQMAADVASRDAELRQINEDLEQRVEERTRELTRTNEQLDRAREEALALLSRERELHELKSKFVSLVSHEVRTPLGVIQSAADVLNRYVDRLTVEQRQSHLDMIFRSVRSLAELVEGVLMLGRVEEGRLQAKPVPLDLGNLCEQIVDEAISAGGRAGAILLELDRDLPLAHADADLLRHIIGNLLSNALKYSAETTHVRFSVKRRGREACFVVQDQGLGIPSQDQDKLFNSFIRGSNVGSRPGTGLGLMIVRQCVRAHGGQVSLESEIGKGTTVSVSLPLFDPHVSITKATASPT